MTIQEAIELYPNPKITNWYTGKFPKKQFQVVELVLFAIGFVATIIGNRMDFYSNINKHIFYAITFAATVLFVGLLIVAATIHVTAWIAMRRIERKRANAMGVSLQEYFNQIDAI